MQPSGVNQSDGAFAYRGQWGGKIENGEEMWWSEPQFERIRHSRRARFFFWLDVRHHFLLRFWKQLVGRSASPKLVLDYGCGTGGTTHNFSAYIRQPIHGLDIFPTQIQIANRFSTHLNSGCLFRELEKDGRIPFSNDSIDIIFSIDVLGHVPNIADVLAEWARVLKPGGAILLFTESNFSEKDRSIMASLARRGANMMTVVPEHISLFPREKLEMLFYGAGLRVKERYSANVWHFFFFPKDYVLLLKNRAGFKFIKVIASIWNRVSKLSPFYPWPFQAMRLLLTYWLGRSDQGTSYFYHLQKKPE